MSVYPPHSTPPSAEWLHHLVVCHHTLCVFILHFTSTKRRIARAQFSKKVTPTFTNTEASLFFFCWKVSAAAGDVYTGTPRRIIRLYSDDLSLLLRNTLRDVHISSAPLSRYGAKLSWTSRRVTQYTGLREHRGHPVHSHVVSLPATTVGRCAPTMFPLW